MLLLAKLLTEELKQPAIPPPTKILPKQAKASPPEPKIKKEYEDFSDGSDDAATDDMDLESVEHLDSYNMDEDRKGALKNVHLDNYSSLLTCYEFTLSGLEKVLSHYPGWVDFPSEQVMFHFYLAMPNGQEMKQVICEPNH